MRWRNVFYFVAGYLVCNIVNLISQDIIWVHKSLRFLWLWGMLRNGEEGWSKGRGLDQSTLGS